MSATAAAHAAKDRKLPDLPSGAPIRTIAESKVGAKNVSGTRRLPKDLGAARWTRVFVTINSNLKTRDYDLAILQLKAAREVTRQMLATPEISKVIDVAEARPINFVTRENLIGQVEALISAELGKQGSIHTHARIDVHHTSAMFYNRKKMKAFFQDRMNEAARMMNFDQWMRREPNIRIKLLGNPNEKEAVEKYVRKDAGADSELQPIQENF